MELKGDIYNMEFSKSTTWWCFRKELVLVSKTEFPVGKFGLLRICRSSLGSLPELWSVTPKKPADMTKDPDENYCRRDSHARRPNRLQSGCI